MHIRHITHMYNYGRLDYCMVALNLNGSLNQVELQSARKQTIVDRLCACV